MNRVRLFAALLLVFGTSALGSAQRQTVIGSEHDLSDGSADGPSVCFFCHVPHFANPSLGLWAHQMPSSTYNLAYPSTTYTEGAAAITTPSPSRLCMSCHDGTIGLGAVNNAIAPYPTTKTLAAAGANMGTDLRKDHPQSFDQWNKNTVNPAFETMHDQLYSSHATGNSAVKLWNGRVECTTCHEPHTPNNDPARPSKFLSINNTGGQLCLVCHDSSKPAPNVLSGWTTSAHATSNATEGATTTGYPNIAAGACNNCHTPHGSGSDRLLKAGGEENACLQCHAVSSSQSRWAQVWVGNTDTTKYMHPVQATGHQPIEDLQSANTPRHSECWDCHDGHGMKPTNVSDQPLQSALFGATGVDQYKNPTNPALHVYEVCFKCHADSTNMPQGHIAGYNKYGYMATRQIAAHNTRLDFTSTLPSHNVVHLEGSSYPDYRSNILKLDQTAGRSLSGNIYCGDCHNGNNPANDGGTGPNGPHISNYAHILERRYDMNLPPPAAGASVVSLSVPPGGGDPMGGPFALCNKCHDIAGLLGGTLPSSGVAQVPGPKDTVFGHHNTHVVQGGISCAVCHAPHGVNSSDAQHHTNLINLDMNLTGPDTATGNWYIDTTSKTCYVSCHYTNDMSGIGATHSGISYGSGGSSPMLRPLQKSIRK